MYKVIKDFIDLKDGNHKYKAGDEFPRSGFTARQTRLQQLLDAEVIKEEKEVITNA